MPNNTNAIVFTNAEANDLAGIVALLANDELGKQREQISKNPTAAYQNAFEKIKQDSNADLIVAKLNHEIVAVAQVNYITYLTYQGGTRAQIEGVRVSEQQRGQGIGQRLFKHIINMAQDKNCHVIQLTTDKSRPNAYKFYEKLGFKNSHSGFKLHLK